MRSRIRVLPDGREICKGYQWNKRVLELKRRAEGHCESHLLPECQTSIDGEGAGLYHPRHYIGENGDPHHIIKRSKERDDRLRNLAYICRDLHMQIDNRQVRWSGSKPEGKP